MQKEAFISSEMDVLRDLRERLADVVSGYQFFPILGERGRIGIVDRDLEVACYTKAATADLLVLIIGRRYGNLRSQGISLTHGEYRSSAKAGKPALVLAEGKLKNAYEQRLAIKGMDQPEKTFDFIEEVRANPKAAFYWFDSKADAIEITKNELAHLIDRQAVDPPARPSTTYEAWIEASLRAKQLDTSLIDTKVFVAGRSMPISSLAWLEERALYGGPVSRTCLLGNYGAGKTALALRAARNLLAKYHARQSDTIPLYVKLRKLERLPAASEFRAQIEELILRENNPFATATELHDAIDQGRAFLLLDGLDEIATAADALASQKVLNDVVDGVGPTVRFALLARTSFFVGAPTIADTEDMMDIQSGTRSIPPGLLADLTAAGFAVATLRKLSNDEVDDYLSMILGKDAEQLSAKLRRIHGLQRLMDRPSLLNMIATTATRILEVAEPGDTQRIRSAEVYRIYVEHQLELEAKKTGDRYPPAKKMRYLRELALRMLREGTTFVLLQDVQALAKKWLEDSDDGAEVVESALVIRVFLDLEGDRIVFSHDSFREYFAACALEKRIWETTNPGIFTDYISAHRRLKEITNFIIDIAERRALSNPDDVRVLLRWLDSPDEFDRQYAAYFLGTIGSAIYRRDPSLFDECAAVMCAAYFHEEIPIVKRALAVALGRAGVADVLAEYVHQHLPDPEHRRVNLQFHLDYYGALANVSYALLYHFRNPAYEFLTEHDFFTLQQILADEVPQGRRNDQIVAVLKKYLGGMNQQQVLERARSREGLHIIRELKLNEPN